MPSDTGAEDMGTALLDASTAIAFIVEDHEAHAATIAARIAVSASAPIVPIAAASVLRRKPSVSR